RPARRRRLVPAAPPRPAARRVRPRQRTVRARFGRHRVHGLLPAAELRPRGRHRAASRGAFDVAAARLVGPPIGRRGPRPPRPLHARPQRARVDRERRVRRDRRERAPAAGVADARGDAPMSRLTRRLPRARLAAGLVVGFLLGAVVTLALQGSAGNDPHFGRPGVGRTPSATSGATLPKTTPEPPATFLAWIPGGMPAGFEQRASHLPGI